MSTVEFVPTDTQKLMILSMINHGSAPEAIGKTIFLKEITDNTQTLSELFIKGYRYLITVQKYQAYWVLRNQPKVSMINQRIAGTNTLAVFEINLKHNPDFVGLTVEAPGEEYYKKITDIYTNYQEAWWREALQNSIDACLAAQNKYGRKGKVSCEIIHNKGKGTATVSVEDNGVGMDATALQKAFLKLGGSSKKTGVGATGGLGKAKEVLFHAWSSWSTHTRTDDMEPEQAIFIKAKYDPIQFPFYNRPTLDSPIPPEFEGRWAGYKEKEGPGTKIMVLMEDERKIGSTELIKIIEHSDTHGITIRFREIIKNEDGTLVDKDGVAVPTNGGWTSIKAENRLPSDMEPNQVLTRGDGSEWARVFHIKKAKKYKEIIIRNNGLYLYTAPGHYDDIEGKVIIELVYRPKGMKWVSDKWVPMSPEDAAKQAETSYGPQELLTENRDGLKGSYSWSFNDILDQLKKKPKDFLKKSREPEVYRTKNRDTEPKDWSQLFEHFKPEEFNNGSDDAVDKLKQIDIAFVKDKIQEVMAGSNIDVITGSPEAIIQILQESLSDSDISKIKKYDLFATTPELQKKVDELETAIDTSADLSFWSGGSDIVANILKNLAKEGNPASDTFLENMTKFLNWDPDFILHDEVGSEVYHYIPGEPTNNPNKDAYGKLFPKAPHSFRPESLGLKEKKLAKFWTESIRLVFILSGVGSNLISEELGLQVGFHFENPPKGKEDCETLGLFRVLPIAGKKPIRAILINPVMFHEKPAGSSWIHRYNISEPKDIEDIVAIAFHEITHAICGVGVDHGEAFGNVLTQLLKMVYRYSAEFNKLLKHSSGVAREEEGAVATKASKGKLRAGKGFYRVIRPKHTSRSRGPTPEFGTIEEVHQYIADKWSDQTDMPIEGYFWEEDTTKDTAKYIGDVEWPMSKQDTLDKFKGQWKSRGFDGDEDEVWRKNPAFAGNLEPVLLALEKVYYSCEAKLPKGLWDYLLESRFIQQAKQCDKTRADHYHLTESGRNLLREFNRI